MKVYAFLADGMEEVELLTVTDCLYRAKAEIVLVSVMGRKEVTSSHKVTILADCLIEDTDVSDADLLFLPGGMPGSTNLGECEILVEMLKKQIASRKRVAAICAAPIVLGMNGMLKGRNATCYPGYEDKLIGVRRIGKNIVTDGNITTGRGMGVALDMGLELVKLLFGREEADRIRKAIQY